MHHRWIRGAVGGFVIVLLVALTGPPAAHAQCPRRWDPVNTKGMDFWINVQGGIALLGGDHKREIWDSEAYYGAINTDIRGRLGMFHLGATGLFGFGPDKTYFQMVDLHLGLDIVRVYRAYYKRILSRRTIATYYGYRYRARLVRTRYCNETQRLARHFIVTTGPKFVFTAFGKGMGAHLTFRYLRFLTRSQHGFWADAVFHYATVNAFDRATGVPYTHEFGGEVRFGYFWTYINNALHVGYFGRAWHLLYLVGFNWGGY